MTAIDGKHAALRAGGRDLGAAQTAEADAADGGRFRDYAGGSIYWHPQVGAFEVHGRIRDRYRAIGSERSTLGYPTTDESGAARGGAFNHFAGGSIYWHPERDAWEVPMRIRDKWESLGWEHSAVGFPAGSPQVVGARMWQPFERGTLEWTAPAGAGVIPGMPKTDKFIKVFLVRFADVAPPAGHTLDWYRRLFFSVDELRTTPDGDPIDGSAYDYFYRASDEAIRLRGEVVDWTANPLNVRDLMHWRDNWTARPGGPTRFIEELTSGAVVNTLRTRGIRTRDDLRVDGRVPDGLVFVSTDVWGGGGVRSMGDAKSNLAASAAMGRNHGTWDSSWDAWLDMRFVGFSGTSAVPAAVARSDGTFDAAPAGTTYRWTSSSVLVHELAHLILGMPDLYTAGWSFWWEQELMAAFGWDNSPPPMSSFTRERGGFFGRTLLPRRTHRGLRVHPLETAPTAYSLPNGPIDRAEPLTLEARTGPQVFAHQFDVTGRHVTGGPDGATTRKHVNLIGYAWGPGTRIDAARPYGENPASDSGDLWWSFENLTAAPDGGMDVDAVHRGQDLVAGYADARWQNGDGQPLRPDVFAADRGHVMALNHSQPLDGGLRYERTLSLHPQWRAGGSVRGAYTVAVPAGGARAYVTALLPDTAGGTDGVTVSVLAQRTELAAPEMLATRRLEVPGARTTLVGDLSHLRGQTVRVILQVEAGASAARDWAHVLEAWVVPTTAVVQDLLDPAAPSRWTDAAGAIAVDAPAAGRAVVRRLGSVVLHNGWACGPRVLQTSPRAGEAGAWVEGTFTGITLPAGTAVLRAQLGFERGRSAMSDGGVFVTASFRTASATTRLLRSETPRGSGQNRVRAWRGSTGPMALGSFGLPIPAALGNATGDLVVRVEAADAANAAVHWTMLRVCSG